jgi:D-alanyl-D-alanine carboxypeptidase
VRTASTSPSAASAAPTPAPGSLEPIQAIPVRTLTVRTAPVRAAGFVSEPVVAHVGLAPPVAATLAPSQPAARPSEPAVRAFAATESEGDASPLAPKSFRGGWMIQIGAYPDEYQARERLRQAQSVGQQALAAADPFTEAVVKDNQKLFRARFAGFDQKGAEAACKLLKRNEFACLPLKH